MDWVLVLTFVVGLLGATLRVATPLIYATIGELYTERAGVLNLGIEGTMFLGAFTGFAIAAKSSEAGLPGYLWLGLLGAVVAGMLMGLLMAFFSVSLGVNQHVSGLGITLLSIGLSLFGFRLIFGQSSVLPSIEPFGQFSIFGNLPVLGPIFEQYLLTYLAFLVLLPLAWWLLYRTSFGLELRSVGENPEAADAAGVNVFRIRTIAIVLGSALMAMGGAFLSLAQLGAFSPGIIAGRGWVCIALVIFAKWDPVRAMWGALLFGGVFALQLRLQLINDIDIPFEIFLALPYLVTILALAIAGRNVAYPGAYLKAYRRE
ncbi:MAG TPA: ABC transporter permease [Anaerolineae bacterium]|nr:ABC transporter permease [Anaerolineae bacterium]HMR66344.1 ABC transporter permease [Anaerolineae bacterium]